MRNLIIVILPLLFASFLLFLKDPPVWPDESTSLYMAKSILSTGKNNAAIYIGVADEAIRSGIGFPPLYLILLGGWTKIFGDSIEAIRGLSLVLGIFSLALFFYLLKFKFKSINLAFWGSLLLSFNVLFSKAARFGRPEILTLLLFLLSLFFWYRRNTWNFILATLFAALASASHPMGIIASVVLGLAVLFSSYTLKLKIIYLSWVAGTFLIITLVWVFTTQGSITDLLTTYQLASLGKMSKISNIWALFISGSVWTVLLLGQAVTLLGLLYLSVKKKSKEYFFIFASTLLTLFWVFWQKENYYVVYLQPLVILAILSVTKHIKLTGQAGLVGFFLFLNIYIQFFYIDSYTPRQTVFTIGSFDYHEFSGLVKKSLPDTKTAIFLSSIPDLYLDLKDNSNYTLHQAIDPNFPLDEENYKSSLDSVDYVIFTWLPHDFLAYYVQRNSQSLIPVSIPGGYSTTIARLKPREKRN